MLCYAMLCYVMLCYNMLCYVIICYVMLCYAMLCYAMFILSYVILCFPDIFQPINYIQRSEVYCYWYTMLAVVCDLISNPCNMFYIQPTLFMTICHPCNTRKNKWLNNHLPVISTTNLIVIPWIRQISNEHTTHTGRELLICHTNTCNIINKVPVCANISRHGKQLYKHWPKSMLYIKEVCLKAFYCMFVVF